MDFTPRENQRFPKFNTERKKKEKTKLPVSLSTMLRACTQPHQRPAPQGRVVALQALSYHFTAKIRDAKHGCWRQVAKSNVSKDDDMVSLQVQTAFNRPRAACGIKGFYRERTLYEPNLWPVRQPAHRIRR